MRVPDNPICQWTWWLYYIYIYICRMSNPIRWSTTHFLARRTKPDVAPDDAPHAHAATSGTSAPRSHVRIAVRRARRRLSPFAMGASAWIYSFPSAGSLAAPMQARHRSLTGRPAGRAFRPGGIISRTLAGGARRGVCGVAVEAAENILRGRARRERPGRLQLQARAAIALYVCAGRTRSRRHVNVEGPTLLTRRRWTDRRADGRARSMASPTSF